MKRVLGVWRLVMGCLLVVAGSLFALTTDVVSPSDLQGCPAPIVECVRRADVVGAYRRDGLVYIYLSSGMTAINDFLTKISNTTGVDTTLVISPGPGHTVIFAGEREYNWAIMLESARAEEATTGPATKPHEQHWKVQVEVEISKSVPLDGLRIPIAVDARAGGDIGELVKIHQERRRRRIECWADNRRRIPFARERFWLDEANDCALIHVVALASGLPVQE